MNSTLLKPHLFRADAVATSSTERSSFTLRSEFVFSDRQLPGDRLITPFLRLNAELEAREASLLALMIYGGLAVRAQIEEALREALGKVDYPVTWIDGGTGECSDFAGFQAFAVSGCPVARVRLGDAVVGSVFEDGNARHCLLGGLGPTSIAVGPFDQTQQTFANLEMVLESAGFKLGDVVRTWFYNKDIVSWYGDFNRVRSALYMQTSFRTGSIPASTGIGASNVAGAALTLAGWAMQPLGPAAYAREIASPLQCPAPAYGSSFARAMEVVSGDARRLLISGTASIWPDGRTAWLNDPTKQVALTMNVIEAILHSRGMGFVDVTRATAYFKKREFKRHFDAWCLARGMDRMPVIALQADVCRDDLLFELELDAVLQERDAGQRDPGFDS